MALDTRMVSMVLAENQNQFMTVKFLTKDNEISCLQWSSERQEIPCRW
jgi:hypothetical protein